MSETFVPPEGPREAELAIVGEAPGREELLEGRPFVGPSGRLLSQMLSSAGILRQKCYITNVSKTKPHNFFELYEDGKQNSPSEKLRALWTKLNNELAELPNLRMVIALGDEALRALTPHRGIVKWRGSILENSKWRIIPSIHPAFILRGNPQLRAVAESDFRKARGELENPRPLPAHTFWLDPAFEQVMDFLETISPGSKIAVDIETIAQNTRCIGIATSKDKAICIPLMKLQMHSPVEQGGLVKFDPVHPRINSRWALEEEWAILSRLNEIFLNPEVLKILQNFPFDSSILAREFGLKFRGLWIDTLVAHHCCLSELPKALDFLGSLYTRVPYYSDYDASSDIETWRYNCLDCVVDYECAEKIEQKLVDYEQEEFYSSHAQPVMLALTSVQNTGIRVDIELRAKMKEETEKELDILRAKFTAHTSLPSSAAASPKQLQTLLYTKLGIPPQYKRATKQTPKRVTTEEESLKAIRRKYPEHKTLIDLILSIRGKAILLSTFLEAPLTPDNRMETAYHATGACTGRISSSSTIWGTGGNLQNIPKSSLRRIYLPDQNHIWIKVDLSQAEVRAVAWLARIPSLMERFRDPNFDIHRWNASNIFHIPEASVSKEQRDRGKTGVHAGDYGMGARTAAAKYDTPYQIAKASIDAYRYALPELGAWWRRVEQEVISSRYLTNPFGRMRVFLGIPGPDMFREAYAQVPQSTVADLVNRALYLSVILLKPLGARVLAQVHDELDVSCPPDKVPECIEILRNLLETPIYFEGVSEPLVIPADFSTGPNWWDQEKWKGE